MFCPDWAVGESVGMSGQGMTLQSFPRDKLDAEDDCACAVTSHQKLNSVISLYGHLTINQFICAKKIIQSTKCCNIFYQIVFYLYCFLTFYLFLVPQLSHGFDLSVSKTSYSLGRFRIPGPKSRSSSPSCRSGCWRTPTAWARASLSAASWVCLSPLRR